MMRMRHSEGLRVLGLKSGVSFEEIKTAYRRLSAQYHPDRNPAGLEMMKLINAAYQCLSDYVGSEHVEESVGDEEELNLTEEMNAALNAIIHLGLTIEVCGVWIWVSGDTRPYKEELKLAGYRWAPKKLMWMWKPADSKSRGRGKFSMDEIRSAHGSVGVKGKTYARLAA
jgi:hypothetical protein